MGYLTAQDMVSRVRSAIGNPDTLMVSDDLILQWLNQNIIRITAKYSFTEYGGSEDVTTASGTAEYLLTATTVLAIENVVNMTGKYDLQRCDETDYDLWVQSTGTTGSPTHYFVSRVHATDGGDRRYITFFPTPNATLTMRVRYNNLDGLLVLDPTATKSPLPSHWDECLINHAIAAGFMHLTEGEKASAFLTMAKMNELEAWEISSKPSEIPASIGRSMRAGIRWN